MTKVPDYVVLGSPDDVMQEQLLARAQLLSKAGLPAPGNQTPWFDLVLPYEWPSRWHPVRRMKWKARHFRILNLEREHGFHQHGWGYLPWQDSGYLHP